MAHHLAGGGYGEAQAVLFLQQAGYLQFLQSTVWDTSWLLSQDSIAGRLLHTLIGYNDTPNGLQIIVYVTTIAIIMGLTRWEHANHPKRRMIVSPAE